MRRMMIAAATAAVLAGAGMLAGGSAQAMTMPGASALASASADNSAVQDVRLVCRRYWNGYFWARRCFETGPRFYPAPRRYYRPRVYFY